jgi:low affinity Fe/Cu permease
MARHRHYHRNVFDGLPDPATENRDTLALQLKLDELIVATRNEIAGIEDAADEQIEKAKDKLLKRAG